MDVAFTEAAVGAGVSTVLLLGALALTTSEEKDTGKVAIFPLMTVLIVGASLIYGTLDMPYYGDPNAPIHVHVGPYYLEEAWLKQVSRILSRRCLLAIADLTH